jgi:hypothetical protein
MYYETCWVKAIMPGKVHVRKLGKSKFLKQAQWLVLDTYHNVMVFTICAAGVWILNNG